MKHRITKLLVFFSLICPWTWGEAGPSAQAPGPHSTPPFYLGAWVGADTFQWGDLKGMGSDSASTIEAICEDLAACGCNSVWVAGFDPFYAEMALMQTWLDAAHRHGLKVVLQGSGFPYAIPKDEPRMLARTRSEVIPTWVKIARKYGRHPALLAYCPVEEIGDNVELGETPTLDALAELGRAVAKVDSVHPVTTIHIAAWYNVAVEESKIRGRDMRVEVADLYVFTHVTDWSLPGTAWETSDEATRAFLDWTGRHVRFSRSIGVPMWLFAQANETTWVRRMEEGGKPDSRPNFRMPTPAEMSFQVWGAILAGAKAVFFFPYNSFPQPPSQDQANLMEWEHGTGIRTLDGQPSLSHQGLAAAGERVRDHLAILGQLQPEGEISEEGKVLARLFRHTKNKKKFVVLLNRDVEGPQEIPAGFDQRWGLPASTTLEAGEGRIIPSR